MSCQQTVRFSLCVISSRFIFTVQFLCLNVILQMCATVMCNKRLLTCLLTYLRALYSVFLVNTLDVIELKNAWNSVGE